jgi:PAS domain S-box-containing protein
MHQLLLRQLKRTLGCANAEELPALLAALNELAAGPATPPAAAQALRGIGELLERVDAVYAQHDRDLALSNRSLELSSSELIQANRRLHEELAQRRGAIDSLRETANELLRNAAMPVLDGHDDNLTKLSQVMAELVRQREESRHQLDQTLASLAQQKFALDQHAIVSITDIDGNIVYANDRFCQINGYAREELLGRNHRLVNSGYHPAAMFEELWRTILQGRVWHGELRNRAKNGGLYWVNATIVPFLDEHGAPYQFIAIHTDISERKRWENELIDAKEAAEAANRAKSEFLANMSHEIRTPMNGIIGMTELALDTDLDSEQRDYLETVQMSADALLGIIDDILDFSKIEAGKLQVENIPFNLASLVASTLKNIAVRADQKGLELLNEIQPETPQYLLGDPGRLRQVLLNLLGNAIKFTERGEILLRVGVHELLDQQVRLHFSVNDSGIGIPVDKQQLIFDAFSQEDSTTTRRFGGTGLGLTICSRLVDLMGGNIWVHSQPGHGSTFHFTVLLALDPANTQAQAEQALPLGSRVLVVDDNAVNRRILSETLGRWGMHSEEAADGPTALEKIHRGRPGAPAFDLILLDGHMPDMDGFAVAAAIRDNPSLHGATLMMLSSAAMHDDTERCKALGIAAYLTKPVTQAELMQSIRMLLGSAPVAPAAARLLTRDALPAKDRLSILLAEDHPVNQQLMLNLLQKWGHRVTLANNGYEALEWAARQDFDLILMDIQMPLMDGLEATRQLRQREATGAGRKTPIYALTAAAMTEDQQRGMEAGVDGYLTKPIQQKHLLEVLAQFKHAEAECAIAAFDYQAGLRQADQEVIDIIGEDFLLQAEQEQPRLIEACANADWERLERIAHTLKGNIANFGAMPLVSLAGDLEKQARSAKGGERRNLAPLVTDLCAGLGRLCVALRQYLAGR